MSDDVIEMVKTEFERYREMRQPWVDQAREYDRLYHMYEDPMKLQVGEFNRANVALSDPFEAVEAVVPRIVGRRPKIQYVARNKNFVKQAENMTSLIDYQLDLMDIEMTIQDVYRDAAKFGSGFAFAGWRHDVKDFTFDDIRIVDGKRVESKITKSKIVYDDPVVEPLSFFQVYTDPFIPDMEKQHSVIIARCKRLSWVLGRIKAGIFKGDADALKKSSMTDEYIQWVKDQFSAQGLEVPFKNDEKDPYGIMLERWTGDQVITTFNNSVVLRDRPTPFEHGKIPVLDVRYVKIGGQFYGKGVIEIMRSALAEKTDNRNATIDAVNANINAMWEKRRGAEVDDADLVFRPNGIIEVDQIGQDIKKMEHSGIKQEAFQLDAQLSTDIRRAVGITDYALGNLPTKRVITAEVNLAQEGLNTRFDMYLQSYEIGWVKRLGTILYQMNQQFIKTEKNFRITGETVSWATVDPQEIQGEFDVIPVSGASRGVNRAFRRQEVLALYNTLKGDPMVKRQKLIALLLDTYDIDNANDLIQLQVRPKQSEDEAKLQAAAENVLFGRTGFIGSALPEEDHAIHVTTHYPFMQTKEYKALPPEVQQKFSAHLREHDDFQKQDQPAPAAQPQGPQAPQANGNPLAALLAGGAGGPGPGAQGPVPGAA